MSLSVAVAAGHIADMPRSPIVPDESDCHSQNGVTVEVAKSLADVLDAWRLVYRTYLSVGLIEPNSWGLHLVPQAVSSQTIVVLRRYRAVLLSTISAYADSSRGLPLDCVYREELNALRARGRKLVEVGMLADAPGTRPRSLPEMADIMRFPFYFTMLSGWDDLVIGVHPRHVPFYERLFGFVQAGPQRSYPLVNDHDVVLLRLDVHRQWNTYPQPRGAAYCVQYPVSKDILADRYDFDGITVGDLQPSPCDAVAA